MNELLCHAAFDAPLTASGEMMFMPAGAHTITPSQGGKAVKVNVLVTAAGAQELETQRAALEAKGKRPYFDFNHEDGPASFWPAAFYWKDGPAPGIYCRGEWSESGRTAVEGKEYRQFSPVFHVDNVRANPAKIAAREHALPNMGGLVNAPAFSNILPFWAKNADGAHSITTNQIADMTPQELAALQAKNTELQTELDGLKAQAAKDQNNAALAAALSAKESEVKLSASVLENETLKAKNAALEAKAQARRESDADAAVKAAVARGALATKDDALHAKWKSLILADASAADLLAAQPSAPALGGRVTAGSVTVSQESLVASLNAFDAEKDAVKRAAIYAKDISPRLAKGEDMPLVAANSPGTLSGTLVSQRTLELLKFTFPVLSAVTADFSDAAALYGQAIKTRTIAIPTVQTYSTSTGWTATDATDSDVTVTINNHVGVPIVFNANTLGSTVRRLFDEHAPAAAYALAKKMVDDLYALVVIGTFTNTGIVKSAATFGRPTVIDMGVALNNLGVPMGPQNRTLLLNSTYFGALAKDSAIISLATFGGNNRTGIITDGSLPDVHGFKVVDAPNLPGTGNLTGFAFSKSALVIATRVPSDYTQALPGASFGNVQVVTDPDLGLSVQQVQYVNHDLGTATQRIALMYGVAAGQVTAGQILTSA